MARVRSYLGLRLDAISISSSRCVIHVKLHRKVRRVPASGRPRHWHPLQRQSPANPPWTSASHCRICRQHTAGYAVVRLADEERDVVTLVFDRRRRQPPSLAYDCTHRSAVTSAKPASSICVVSFLTSDSLQPHRGHALSMRTGCCTLSDLPYGGPDRLRRVSFACCWLQETLAGIRDTSTQLRRGILHVLDAVLRPCCWLDKSVCGICDNST